MREQAALCGIMSNTEQHAHRCATSELPTNSETGITNTRAYPRVWELSTGYIPGCENYQPGNNNGERSTPREQQRWEINNPGITQGVRTINPGITQGVRTINPGITLGWGEINPGITSGEERLTRVIPTVRGYQPGLYQRWEAINPGIPQG